MSRDRTRHRIGVVGLALAVAMVPALAFASHEGGFEDVPDSNVFHDDIAWMQETGVTRGCNPPENTEYCPDRGLTRGEEAAFFHRYDGYLRNSLEPRLLPENCEAGQVAEYDGANWNCATAPTVSGGTLSAAVGEQAVIAAGGTEQLMLSCDEGDVALTAGVFPGTDAGISVTLDGSNATITVDNTAGAEPVTVTPYALCAATA